MKKVCYAILILVVLAHVVPGQDAKSASGDDPVVEQRLKDLSKELRCLVCQNETLADSQAGLAEDLRREIREQIKAGKSDKEIISFLTARYGQFILYRPQVTPTTYLLWFGPFIILIAGFFILFRYIRQRRDAIVTKPLTSEEHRLAVELLSAKSGKETI
jgi:cytochrome c-type biogenesis protein CcmH